MVLYVACVIGDRRFERARGRASEAILTMMMLKRGGGFWIASKSKSKSKVKRTREDDIAVD